MLVSTSGRGNQKKDQQFSRKNSTVSQFGGGKFFPLWTYSNLGFTAAINEERLEGTSDYNQTLNPNLSHLS